MNLDIVEAGMDLLHAVDSHIPKQDKITLLSRQSSQESLDFRMLSEELESRMPGVAIDVCISDPETVDKAGFARSVLEMSRKVAESRVCIVDGYIPSISVPKLDAQTKVIQIWHALGAIKKFGYQSLDTDAGRTGEEARKLHMHANYDWVVAAGPGAVPAYARAFGYPEDRVLPLGLPRMDYLLDPAPDSAYRCAVQRIRERNPRLSGKAFRVVYVPTLRKGPGMHGWLTREVEALASAFEPFDCQLIVKGHPLDDGWDHSLASRYPNVLFVRDAESSELLGLADAAISDYSAISFEAALLGVPTYFYVPDIDSYRVSPGLNIDPLQQFPDCSFMQAGELARAVMKGVDKQGNSFAQFADDYFEGIGYGATERLAALAEAAFAESKGESPACDSAVVKDARAEEHALSGAHARAAGAARQHASWAFQVYECLKPLLSGKAFAFGDTCVGAVFYHGYFSDMTELSLAALRNDFDMLRAPIAQLAHEAGWQVWGANDTEQPYLCITPGPRAVEDPRATFCLYPMDRVPHQSILRFKMLSEASSLRPGDLRGIEHLKRYRCVQTGVVSRLFGNGRASGVMGERTIQQRTIREDALFPLRSVAFEDGTIELPRDISSWASEPTPARQQITDIIQKDGLESLEEIKRVCGYLGTKFFLVGGSMLGAVRHEGYIPWDDDLDVGMLRADYQQFVAKGPAELDPGYFIQLPETDPHIHYIYVRLRHEGTDYITLYNEGKHFDKSLWVDVFPFDAAPNNRYLAKAQEIAARSFARASMGFKRRQEYVLEDMADPHPLLKEDYDYLHCYARIAPYFPVKLCDRLYHLAAEFLNPYRAGKPGTRYASFIPTYTTIEAGEADGIRWVPFEGHDMPIIDGAEKFLERQYGDYLRLPEPHQRQTDHGFLRLELSDGTQLEA